MGKQREELIGFQFGNLTIVEYIGNHKRRDSSENKYYQYFKCICNCGDPYCKGETIQSGADLKNHPVKSCGGRNIYGKYKYNGIPRNAALQIAGSKGAALSRGMRWGLTDDEAYEIIQMPCFFHDEGNCIINKTGYSGIDRLDNSVREYTVDTVIPCCGKHNGDKKSITASMMRKCVNELDIRQRRLNDEQAEAQFNSKYSLLPQQFFTPQSSYAQLSLDGGHF